MEYEYQAQVDIHIQSMSDLKGNTLQQCGTFSYLSISLMEQLGCLAEVPLCLL